MSLQRIKLRSGRLPLSLAALSLAMALAQRPGTAVADTKIDLHVDPAAFLGDVASVWSSSGGLGQVQAGQYAGYLFPMAPFFWLGDLLGLAPWLVQRLWLGGVIALACWGTVRLMDVLVGRPRGSAHAVAGVLVALNPYVLEFAARTSVTLLGYAVLPWLLLAVYRGVREPRRWTWPAAAALLVACSGGGVNAAVTAWLLLAPLGLLLYEVHLGTVSWRGAFQFAWRAVLLGVGASLWWLVPVVLHAGYGVNFLPFTESPGAIWGTSSLSESIRLMGYWLSYLGTGFGLELFPSMETSRTLLYDAPPLVASFLVPGLAVAGYAWSRRQRYAPFLLALLLVGLFVMVVGFPEGVPLRRAVTFAYYRVEGLQFLRTTYKAGPLVALALACLAGLAAAELHRRLGRRRSLLALAAVTGVALVVATNWPVFQGRMLDKQVAYDTVPGAWRQAARDVDRMPPATRALVLPGQLFPFYRWGGTQDPILAALTKRPVTARSTVPYSDIHAADLLYTTDNLVQQRRLVPGQLTPLLSLMSVGSVITGSDDDRDRSGSAEPLGVAQDLARQPGLGRPVARYGPRTRFGGVEGDLGVSGTLPQVRRYDPARVRRLVRVEPRAGQTTVDGSASTLAAMAAFGAIPRSRALAYAGDRSPAQVRGAARAGGAVVIGDGNRRRVFTAARARQDHGATVAASDPLSIDSALLQPFPDRGTDGQTVAVVRGAKSVRAPYSPSFPQFPEHRPTAAFDGRAGTYWIADRYLARQRRYVDIDFGRPVRVDRLDLLPQRESNTDLTEVEIAGRRHPIHRGWNVLRPGLGRVSKLRVRVTGTRAPNPIQAGPGAIAEIRIAGVRVSDRLRPPRLAEKALAATDLSRSSLSYLFERTTGDDPYRRSKRPNPNRGYVPIRRNLDAALVSDPGDGEKEIERTIDPPDHALVRARGVGVGGAGRLRHGPRPPGRLPRQRPHRLVGPLAEPAALPRLGSLRRPPRQRLGRAAAQPRCLPDLVAAPAGGGPRADPRARGQGRAGTGIGAAASRRPFQRDAGGRRRRARTPSAAPAGAPLPPRGPASAACRAAPAAGCGRHSRGPRRRRAHRAHAHYGHGRRRLRPAHRERGRCGARHALRRLSRGLRGRPPHARTRLRSPDNRPRAPGRVGALGRRERGPAGAALVRARAGGHQRAERARDRLRQRGPRPPRRRPCGCDRSLMAGPGRELQPGLARLLQRPLAGDARADRRFRQRLAGRSRLPRCALCLRAQPRRNLVLPAVGADRGRAAGVGGRGPAAPAPGLARAAAAGRPARRAVAVAAGAGCRTGAGAGGGVPVRGPRRGADRPGGGLRAVARAGRRHAGRGGRPAGRRGRPGGGTAGTAAGPWRLQQRIRDRPAWRPLVGAGGVRGAGAGALARAQYGQWGES